MNNLTINLPWLLLTLNEINDKNVYSQNGKYTMLKCSDICNGRLDTISLPTITIKRVLIHIIYTFF